MAEGLEQDSCAHESEIRTNGFLLGSLPRMPPKDPVESENSKKAQKREHILACARDVFATRGVVGATMQDIAVAAGVSKGALYLLFASKEELYYQLVADVIDGLFARMWQMAESGSGSGFERARELLRTYAHYYAEDVTRFRLSLGWLQPDFQLNESIPNAADYSRDIVQIMRMAIRTVEAGQLDGSIRPDLDARRTVLQAWAGTLGLLFIRARATDRGPLPPQADVSVWSGLAGTKVDDTSFELLPLLDGYIELFMRSLRPELTANTASPICPRCGGAALGVEPTTAC